MNNIEIVDELKQLIKSNNTDDWMTLKDACKYAKLSQSTLFRAITDNRLKTSKTTGKLLFKRIWIDKFLGI
tara:strand:- start:318 stop:530 length:213 start_codon:yes stop_codon:yes gene_type:complete